MGYPVITMLASTMLLILWKAIKAAKKLPINSGQLQAQMPSPPRIRSTASIIMEEALLPEKPGEFNGDKSKAFAWMNSVESYFREIEVGESDSDADITERKIIFALSYLTGNATQLFASHWRRHINDGPDKRTWAAFKASFYEYFSVRKTAQEQLENLYQDTQSAENYTLRFKASMEASGYDKNMLIRLYKKGLNQSLLRYIVISGVPDDLNGWMEKAQRIDRDLSWYFKQMARRHGLCYACREKGHIARNCPRR